MVIIALAKITQAYYSQYQAWQKKTDQIGREILEQGGDIRSRKDKLKEEYAEIRFGLSGYFEHLKHLEHPSKKDTVVLVDELGDVVNVSGIMFATLNEQLPFEQMLVKLIYKHFRHHTKLGVSYIPGKNYSPKQVFEKWSQEIAHIGELNKPVTKKELEEKYQILSDEYLSVAIPTADWCQYGHVRHKEDIIEGLGDMINISAIMMAIIGVPVPWDELLEKLDSRDEKNKTGPHFEK